MKFFVALVAVVAVAVASPVSRSRINNNQLAAIIEAIQSPLTDPSTAALLEQQLQQILESLESISVGPVIVNPAPEPIVVGPGVIEFPVIEPSPEPIVVSPPIVDPPVVVSPPVVEPPTAQPPVVVLPPPAPEPEVESSSAPLVQLILNINQA
ncbi:cytadherence high molecular weight protein 3-like isoform X2 [Galleria mellonella]|nr:cytadherence high molecular weight protein 3-like isoform X2 [Galleria mellonella]